MEPFTRTVSFLLFIVVKRREKMLRVCSFWTPRVLQARILTVPPPLPPLSYTLTLCTLAWLSLIPLLYCTLLSRTAVCPVNRLDLSIAMQFSELLQQPFCRDVGGLSLGLALLLPVCMVSYSVLSYWLQ